MTVKSYIVLIILYFILLFPACSQNNGIKQISFNSVGEYELELKNSVYNIPHDIQLLNNSDSLYVYLNDSKVLLYNIRTKSLIDSILLKKAMPLLSFRYISSDSIYLLYNAAANQSYDHEHSLQRINKAGELLQDYSFQHTPAISSDKNINPDSAYYMSVLFQKLPISNDNLFLNFNRYSSINIGSPDYNYEYSFIAGSINCITNEFSFFEKVKIPYLKPGYFYPRAAGKAFVKTGHNGNPIYAFAHTDVILEYDTKNDTVIRHRISSVLVDSILPPLKTYCSIEWERDMYKYSFLYYDDYRKYYYRLIQLPESEFGKWRYSIVVSDSSFNEIGEGILPQGMHPINIYFTQDYIGAFNYQKTLENKGKIVFTKYKLELTDSDKENVCAAINRTKLKLKEKKEIRDYLKDLNHITDTSFAAIIIPLSQSCPACVEKTLNFYAQNEDTFIDLPVYLIVSDKNTVKLLAKLKDYGLNPKNPKIKPDFKDNYLAYHNFDSYNPRLIIVKDGKTISDKIYNPTDIIQLQRNVAEFIGNGYEEVRMK